MTEEKQQRLGDILQEIKSVLVAFSGGVDSAFLLSMAHQVLGDSVLAVTAESPIHPRRELARARRLAKALRVRHRIIRSEEFNDRRFLRNDPRRCYYCKDGLFKMLLRIAREEGLNGVLDGSNQDDLGDYRPGAEALRKLGIRSPLQEAGLRKEEIRRLSREMGLEIWDAPAAACLVSRIPYGMPVKEEDLRKVDAAEELIRELGCRQVRVRHHGNLARIEVGEEDLKRILSDREKIFSALKEAGYIYVTLDLEGYRTGSLNEVLSDEDFLNK